MKDRYLFKAKRIDNGKWEEGWLFKTQEHTYIAYDRQFDDDLFFSPNNIFIVVDENTICQYTGLTDKNGCKIWENDIVLFEEEICMVSWSDRDAQFTIESEFVVEHFGNVWSADCEVYGNIFDNPELVKGGV